MAAAQASGNRQDGGLLTFLWKLQGEGREYLEWKATDQGSSLPLVEVEVSHMCPERNTWESLGGEKNRNWVERCCFGYGV